jgi:hypothetical protein
MELLLFAKTEHLLTVSNWPEIWVFMAEETFKNTSQNFLLPVMQDSMIPKALCILALV